MINIICFAFAVFGGINWLSIGLVQFDLIAGIFGSQSHVVSRIIYVLVGIASGILVYTAISKKGEIILGKKKQKSENSATQQDMLG